MDDDRPIEEDENPSTSRQSKRNKPAAVKTDSKKYRRHKRMPGRVEKRRRSLTHRSSKIQTKQKTRQEKKRLGEPVFTAFTREGVRLAEAVASLPVSSAASTFIKKKAGNVTDVRARRLMKELKEIERLQGDRLDPVFTVELVNENLFEWHVRLHQIDPDSALARDFRELGITHILLHLIFPDNFPFAPPFMRVIEPQIHGGYVMEGGAICMELLTPQGWASAYTVEAVVMQFAASVVKGHGYVGYTPACSSRQFSLRRAEEEFRSLVKRHAKYGWFTPALSDG